MKLVICILKRSFNEDICISISSMMMPSDVRNLLEATSAADNYVRKAFSWIFPNAFEMYDI